MSSSDNIIEKLWTEERVLMSTLSKFVFDPIKAAFSKAVEAGGPASQPAAQSATDKLTQAQNLVESAVTDLANIAVNSVLAMIPGGTAVEGFADEMIDQIIAGLMAKKTGSAPAPAKS